MAHNAYIYAITFVKISIIGEHRYIKITINIIRL
jgi:hypothetical protein